MIFKQINKKGENKMMTKEERLNKQLFEQQQALSSLARRVSDLVDQMMAMERDIGYFKKTVASDLKVVNETLKIR